MKMGYKTLNILTSMLLLMLMTLPAVAGEVHQQAAKDMESGRYDTARLSLQAQVKYEPRDHHAWFLLGVLYAKQQYFHQAIEAFRRVIELKPTLAEPHNNLAVIYNELDDLHAAVKELEQSLKKRPDYAIAEENIADLYVKLALKSYKSSLEKGENPQLEQRYAKLLQVRDPQVQYSPAAIVKQVKKTAVVKRAAVQPKVTRNVVTKKTVTKISIDKAVGVRDEKTSVLAAVELWRAAWSEQRVDDYFAAYGKGFQVKKKYASVKSWQKVARRVIENKTYLDVQLKAVSVMMGEHDQTATVQFTQYFKSNNYNVTGVKFLRMQRDGDAWMIVQEGSGVAVLREASKNQLPDDAVVEQNNTTKTKVLLQLAPVQSDEQVKKDVTHQADVQDDLKELERQSDPQVAVLSALEAWRAAWSAQDVDAYFSAYGKEFQVKKSLGSVAEWKKVMRRVISNKAFIDVQLDDIYVVMSKDGTVAQVQFLQYFRSDTYQDDDLKLLEMRRFGDVWKIVREESVS